VAAFPALLQEWRSQITAFAYLFWKGIHGSAAAQLHIAFRAANTLTTASM